MRRLVVVVTGVLLAFLAGCTVLAGAVLAWGASLSGPEALAVARAAALLVAEAGGGDRETAAGLLLAGGWAAGPLLCGVPVGLTALLGEMVGARSWTWAAGVTAALTVAVPVVASLDADLSDLLVPGRRALPALILLGTLTGSVFWMVAGRINTRAGRAG